MQFARQRVLTRILSESVQFEKDVRQEADLEYQEYRDKEGELLVLRLVVEQVHSGQRADGSAKEGQQQKDGFGNTPLFLLCLELVDAECGECHYVDYQNDNCY